MTPAPSVAAILAAAEAAGWPRLRLAPRNRMRIGEAAWRQAVTLATEQERAALLKKLLDLPSDHHGRQVEHV